MSPARREAARPYLLGLGLLVAAVLAVQRWVSWGDAVRAGIRDTGFGADMRFYEVIARAAPSFPDRHVLRPYAERFPTHWLVGVIGDATGLGLHPLYRVAELLVLALVIAVVYLVLARVGLGAAGQMLALAVLVASAYPVHYLLAAPGMLSDGIFVLGLSLTLLGFAQERLAVVLVGLTIAMLGRQTAIPVGVAAALWAAFVPSWRQERWRRAAA